MRQDECYVFNTDVVSLYKAYLTAAQNPPFERSCKEEPYHTITFGLNFSFKYNFNGGSCIMRFMPYPGGSAVNLRFVLAQAAAGRTGRYAQDLTERAEKVLGISGKKFELNVDLFLREENKVTPTEQRTTVASYVPVDPPIVAADTEVASYVYEVATDTSKDAHTEDTIFCTKCGKKMPGDALFCAGCGEKLQHRELCCSRCGTKALEDAAFCHICGNKL